MLKSNIIMTYDLAIVGGGPAGAAAAVYAARKRLKTIFITKDWVNQSTVSEKIENWIGTVAITGLELSNNLEKHVKAYADGIIDIKENEYCVEVKKLNSGKIQEFVVVTNKDSYQAKTVLVASGSHRRKLEIPGADKYEHKGLTYCATCDGPIYSGQDVAVIGGGNAGFESAAQLMAYCKNVTILSRSEFKADPTTVEKVLSNSHVQALQFSAPKEIKGDKFVTSLVYTDTKSNIDKEIFVTGIFAEVGSIPNTDFIKNIASVDKFGRIVVNSKTQRASVPGIWAAGDCTDGLYHQNNIAAGDAIKAIEDIYYYLHLTPSPQTHS